MTSKAYCAKHERAYPSNERCPYCETPSAEPDTDRITLPNLDDWLKQYVEGHGFDASGMYAITKPHLHLGNEGKYADPSMYDQCGAAPVEDGAREAYDRIHEIKAPLGWTAMACWTVSGKVHLELRGPELFLGSERCVGDGYDFWRDNHERDQVDFTISRDGVKFVSRPCNTDRRGPPCKVSVDGVEGVSSRIAYSTMPSRRRVA